MNMTMFGKFQRVVVVGGGEPSVDNCNETVKLKQHLTSIKSMMPPHHRQREGEMRNDSIDSVGLLQSVQTGFVIFSE